MLIDTHCHLDFPQFDSDRDNVIKRAEDNSIKYIVNVGSSYEASLKSRDLASKYKNIYFSLGFHPHHADDFKDEYLENYKNIARDKKLVAIGEVGLDYYRNLSSKEKQTEVFDKFISFAKRLELPLIVHCREAESDVYDMLNASYKDFSSVVVHCFSGPSDFLDKCLLKNAMFSFTANITYPKATDLRDYIKRIPLDNIMVETDAPYLAPQKHRGKRNEPSNVILVAQEIASIKNNTFDKICEVTTDNATRFFKLNEN